MNQTTSKNIRVLAIAPSARGFGYCAMEGREMLERGYKGAKGHKNLQALAKIERMLERFLPDVLVLPDVNDKGSRRAPRIKALHRKIVELAELYKCQVALVSGRALRNSLLGKAKGTKHEMAERVAQKFPELAAKLPPIRRAWDSENGRMDLFDAVGLAVAFHAVNE